ncbi:MAG: uncharacterized protein PWP65_1457 [Clostridia bacterium]|nr:uncharacterized protein [Clostridia bacterium]
MLKTTLSNLPLGQKDIANFVTTLEQKLVWYPLALATEEEIHTLVAQAKELVENLDAELVQGEGDVTVGYLLNSKIIATGNVTVTRIGCDNCTIEAGKKVVIHGAFRGGEISAGEDVYVEELGSRRGARTLIATSEGRAVTIGHAYESSFVRIGNKTYSFTSEQREIRLRLSREGYFDIIPISGTKKLFPK